MALTAWNGRTSGQTNANSPGDQTLMDGIRLDLDHLRQFGYGDGVGGYLTPIEGHDHDGSNSQQIDASDFSGTITEAQLGSNIVSQGKLKSTTSTGTCAGNTTVVMTGGTYVFYPQTHTNGDNSVVGLLIVTSTTSSYATHIANSQSGTTLYFQYRYIQSSGTEHWFWIVIDKKTGEIVMHSESPDHVCFGNGDNPLLLPHPFISFFNQPVSAEYELILLDMESINELKRQAAIQKKEILSILKSDYDINLARSITWQARDIDGSQVLDNRHDSYSLREIKPKSVII